jgi:hypothetical protein
MKNINYLLRGIPPNDWNMFKKNVGNTIYSKGDIARALRKFIKDVAEGKIIYDRWNGIKIKTEKP